MTLEQFIAAQVCIRDRYKNLDVPPDPYAAAKEELTLGKMTERHTYVDDNKKVTFAVAFCRACIDTILPLKRAPQYDIDDRNYTAMLWVRKYPDWTIADVKLFAALLDSGQLPTTTLSGREVKDFISVDTKGFFDKLDAYEAKRPAAIQRQKADRIAGLEGTIPQGSKGKDECRPRPPIWEIDPFYQTHDWSGKQMPENWNYKAYWAAKPTSEEVDEYCPNLRPKVHALITDKWQTQRTNQETINF